MIWALIDHVQALNRYDCVWLQWSSLHYIWMGLSRMDDSFTIQVFEATFGKHYSGLCINYYVDDIYGIILFWRVMEKQH